MAQYSLFVLKVPLNTKQAYKISVPPPPTFQPVICICKHMIVV